VENRLTEFPELREKKRYGGVPAPLPDTLIVKILKVRPAVVRELRAREIFRE